VGLAGRRERQRIQLSRAQQLVRQPAASKRRAKSGEDHAWKSGPLTPKLFRRSWWKRTPNARYMCGRAALQGRVKIRISQPFRAGSSLTGERNPASHNHAQDFAVCHSRLTASK
jgi:hypothetical protein